MLRDGTSKRRRHTGYLGDPDAIQNAAVSSYLSNSQTGCYKQACSLSIGHTQHPILAR